MCFSQCVYCVVAASATYGLTANGIKERTQQLNRYLNMITTLKDKSVDVSIITSVDD
jgi:hypothetical protein